PGLVEVIGSLDTIGPDEIRGWAYSSERGAPPLRLELFDGDQMVGAATADGWRTDLEDQRDGDRACGFRIPFPQQMLGGPRHRIDLRVAGGASLFDGRGEAPIP